ncbi:MAG: NifU family protein [Myxococcales bacterium]|nr:MAG: NifU family protein [Myxococcales bacterium]
MPSNDEDATIPEEAARIIDEVVRPLIEIDGGAIQLIAVDQKSAIVELSKACVGCPGAYYTKEFIVKPALRKALGSEELEVSFVSPGFAAVSSSTP